MPNENPVLHKKHVARLQREQQQSKIILYTFIGILAAVLLLVLYGYLDINYFQLKRPVAKVGETEILTKQFEARVRLQRQQLLAQYQTYTQYAQFGIDVNSQLQQIQSMLDSPSSLGKSVLDQMINEEIIRQEAAKRGITVSEEEVNELTEGAFGYFPNGSPTPSTTPTEVTMPEPPAGAFDIVTITPLPSATPENTSEPTSTATSAPAATIDPALITGTPEATATLVPTATFTPTITATVTATTGPTSTPEPTGTPYTQEGFDKQFSEANERLMALGFDGNVYKEVFENQLLESKLKDIIAADVARTEEQVWARHILVGDEATALNLIEKLKSGDDFAALAQEFSTDTGSGALGGDLGWFGAGAMVPEFETAAFALEKPGDFTTTPVPSQYGFHIIQLIAKQERPLSVDQYNAARDKVFREWLTAAFDEYGVEIFDFWQERVPSEPNFITLATEAANAQNTALAEQEAATEAP